MLRFAGALLAVSVFSAAAQAVPLLDTGFESPDYVVGDLVGQQGWDAVGFFDDDIVSVNVQSGVVKTGSQAVSLTGSGEGAGAFAYNLTPFTPSGAEQIVNIGFDMQWGAAGSTKSYLYGVQVYDDSPALNLVASVAASQVLGFYNAVVFDEDSNPIAIPGATVTPGTWHRFELSLNYLTKTYIASMDGISSGEIPFMTPTASSYGEADLFRDAGLGNANDTAYFDNLSSVTSVVPEPTTLGLLGGAALVALRRRA